MKIFENPFFQKMEDLEVVLRFFALRNVENYRLGMAGFLDLYMIKAREFQKADIDFLNDRFIKTINLASNIFHDKIFRPYDPRKEGWSDKPQKAFYDAVMIALERNLDKQNILLEKKDLIIEETIALFKNNESGTFTGRRNTKGDVEDRINYFDNMLKRVISM